MADQPTPPEPAAEREGAGAAHAPARPRTPTRTQIISAMFRLLARQVDELETSMGKTGEKEVALLGNMAKNLEKLMDLQRADRGTDRRAAPRRDMAALRLKLAKRIDELRQG